MFCNVVFNVVAKKNRRKYCLSKFRLEKQMQRWIRFFNFQNRHNSKLCLYYYLTPNKDTCNKRVVVVDHKAEFTQIFLDMNNAHGLGDSTVEFQTLIRYAMSKNIMQWNIQISYRDRVTSMIFYVKNGEFGRPSTR